MSEGPKGIRIREGYHSSKDGGRLRLLQRAQVWPEQAGHQVKCVGAISIEGMPLLCSPTWINAYVGAIDLANLDDVSEAVECLSFDLRD
jgi:hypothetical protein